MRSATFLACLHVLFCGILLACLPLNSVKAQHRLVVNYTVDDGLTSGHVYYALQDKKGFLWFSTDNGISRFDGKRFVNFNAAQGLPDNDIVALAEDNIGRIWVGCFNGQIAYIKDGVVCNSSNTPELRKVTGQGYIRLAAFDRKLVITRSLLGKQFEVDEAGVLREISFSGGDYIAVGKYLLSANAHIYNKLVLFDDTYKRVDSVLFQPGSRLYGNMTNTVGIDDSSFVVLSADNKIHRYRICRGKIILHSVLEPGIPVRLIYKYNGVLWVDRGDGAVISVDSQFREKAAGLRCPAPGPVNRFFVDRHNNFWLCTPGSGVFLLPDNGCSYYRGKSLLREDNIQRMAGGPMALYAASNNTIQNLRDGMVYTLPEPGLLRVDKTTDMIVTDAFLGIGRYSTLVCLSRNTGRIYNSGIRNVKCLLWIGGDTILAGTSSRCLLVKLPGEVIDTAFRGRTSAVCALGNDSILVGTNKGLFVSHKMADGSWATKPYTTHLLLREANISCIAKKGDLLLIGTVDKGLLLVRGARAVQVPIAPGMLNFNCRKLVADKDGAMWMATYSGVYRLHIDTEQLHADVYRKGKENGLLSNFVSDLIVADDSVYASGPTGISVFPRRQEKAAGSAPDVIVNSITVNGHSHKPDKPFALPYGKNDIRISYSGLDFKSVGNVRFSYRLAGHDDEWKYTHEDYVSYSSLAPGTYRLELMACGSEGIWSPPVVTTSFSIVAPFWQRPLTIVLFGAILLLLGWWVARWLWARRHAREIATLNSKRRALETELTALKAQMDPHFLFNSLNIAQYFITNEKYREADEYLGRLADLLRDTLEISGKTSVSISEEAEYIANYLELESMRTDMNLVYHIECQPKPAIFQQRIPSMILPPHVENALKHGLKHKRNGKRVLTIRFLKVENATICEVEDNGIGRQASLQMKHSRRYDRPSRGVGLSEGRLRVYEQLTGAIIHTEILDVYEKGTDKISGTLVRITINER